MMLTIGKLITVYKERPVRCATSVCKVDGQWSSWSSWSNCDPDCRRHRRRLCDSPSPQNDGRYCDGADLSTENCTQLLCTGLLVLLTYHPISSPAICRGCGRIVKYVGTTLSVCSFITSTKGTIGRWKEWWRQ